MHLYKTFLIACIMVEMNTPYLFRCPDFYLGPAQYMLRSRKRRNSMKWFLANPPDRISELLHSMQSCISDVEAWATANMLKLNDSKTELMLVTSKRSKHLHNLPTSITIGNAQIPFKQSVKNLGFTLDSSYYECTYLQYCSYTLL